MNNLNDIFFAPVANQDLTYDQVLEDVQRYFAENHASTIAEAGEGNAERATTLLKELMVQYIVKRKYAIEGLTTEELCEKLYEDMAGYSFLKKWIYKPGIEEVNINAYNDIEVIEAGGRSIKIPDKFSSPQHAIDVVRRMLNACGMVIDDTMPSVVGFLDKNIRISVDKTPIVDPDVGINASIRIVNQQTVSEQKLLDSGSATAEMLHFLMACIRYGVSVCIAGSTGSGKTTIMAWLLSNVPNNQRLITIEEGSREFDLVKRDENGNILNSVIHLLTRPSENPALNINQDFLLERVLRKHPNVIGVGEMRSAAESLSAAESSRTGHTVCTTIHSNSCNSTYRRMMTLAKRKYSMDDAVRKRGIFMSDFVIETKKLTKIYGEQTAVSSVDIHVKPGRIYGLLGRNGAGKTTIMKMILGLTPITSGEVDVFGQNIKGHEKRIYPRIGAIIETPGFYPNLTGTENLEIFAKLRGTPRPNAVKNALEVVGLPYRDKKLFSKYSLGMKQRLGIANAILHDPELLILDEPTNGLDPIGIAEVRNFIKDLSVDRGKTILISSHILSEIALLADDIGIIDHGVLLEESSMEDLEKKNRKYIQLQVSDVPKASLILERQFHVTDYAVQDEHNLRLYDTALDMAAINKALVVQDVAVISSQICNDTLEDYFKQITGGEGIA